ncbi:hypothetical protein ACQP3F_29340, partial [Escherichia coli]
MALKFQLSNTKNIAAISGDENYLGINNGVQIYIYIKIRVSRHPKEMPKRLVLLTWRPGDETLRS